MTVINKRFSPIETDAPPPKRKEIIMSPHSSEQENFQANQARNKRQRQRNIRYVITLLVVTACILIALGVFALLVGDIPR